MVTEEEYEKACNDEQAARAVILQYGRERAEAFEQRLKDSPIFTDEELHYSRSTLCPCGHGLAYPKDCGAFHYWDCSAILKGIADASVQHTGRLPFAFYDVKGERGTETTRGVYRPKVDVAQNEDNKDA